MYINLPFKLPDNPTGVVTLLSYRGTRVLTVEDGVVRVGKMEACQKVEPGVWWTVETDMFTYIRVYPTPPAPPLPPGHVMWA